MNKPTNGLLNNSKVAGVRILGIRSFWSSPNTTLPKCHLGSAEIGPMPSAPVQPLQPLIRDSKDSLARALLVSSNHQKPAALTNSVS